MPTRLLHIADVHLGADGEPEQHLKEFAAFCRLSRRLAPDAVAITGDFFENNRVRVTLVSAVADLLAELPRVVILPGNHDAYDETSVYRRFDLERGSQRVRVIRAHEGEEVRFADLPVVFWGRAAVDHSPAFRPLEGLPPRPERGLCVALAHGHYLEGSPPTLLGSPIYAADLAAADWDYTALGHWPEHTVVRGLPPACYAGELVALGGACLGAVLVDLEPGRPARFRHLVLPLEG